MALSSTTATFIIIPVVVMRKRLVKLKQKTPKANVIILRGLESFYFFTFRHKDDFIDHALQYHKWRILNFIAKSSE